MKTLVTLSKQLVCLYALISDDKSMVMKSVLPKKIGNLSLLRTIEDGKLSTKYKLGVYKNNGKKYFVKKWSGKIRNYDYFDLLGEYQKSRIIYKKAKKLGLQIPKPIKLIKGKDYVIFVSEYINANNSLPLKTTDVLETLKRVESLYKDLNKSEIMMIGSKTVTYMLLSYCIFLLAALIKGKINIQQLISYLKCFMYAIFRLRKIKISLNHGDLHSKNMIVSQNGLYLIDFGDLHIGFAGYDAANFSYNEGVKLPLTRIDVNNSLKMKFLQNYIQLNNMALK